MGHIQVPATAIELRNGVDPPLIGEEKADAFQVSARSGNGSGHPPPGDDIPAHADHSGDGLGAGLRGVQEHIASHIDIAHGGVDHCIEAGHRSPAGQIGCGECLQGLDRSEHDVVVVQRSTLRDGHPGPRTHLNLLSPAVHHGEAHLGVLLDIVLGDADVQPPLNMGGGGAAGDHMQLRALLGDDDVVHPLVEIGGAQIQAAFHRKDGLHVLLGADEEACRRGFGHICRVLVCVRGHQLPPVVLQEVVLFQGRGDIHDLHPFVEGLGHYRGLIHLHISPGGFVIQGHAHVQSCLLYHIGQIQCIIDSALGLGIGLVALQVYIGTKERLLISRFAGLLLYA